MDDIKEVEQKYMRGLAECHLLKKILNEDITEEDIATARQKGLTTMLDTAEQMPEALGAVGVTTLSHLYDAIEYLIQNDEAGVKAGKYFGLSIKEDGTRKVEGKGVLQAIAATA